jgi:hypothetical protein
MKTDGIQYIGGDIVRELIDSNKKRFPGVDFRQIDLMNDRLPKVDLILCRDCLVHLPLPDGSKAIDNFYKSGARWLLSTTFTKHSENIDIAPGKWRPLNLQLPPFNLPKPVEIIFEGCEEQHRCYADKALGLWRLEDCHFR